MGVYNILCNIHYILYYLCIGLAIRLCNTDRDWESVNVLACQSQEFTELSQEVCNVTHWKLEKMRYVLIPFLSID